MRNKTRDERDAQVTVREVAADLKDRVKETRHQVAAEGEHAKRAVFGDAMTAGEKLTSVALGNRAQDSRGGRQSEAQGSRSSEKIAM